MFDFHGRVALVTGGSSGLGFEFAKALAGQGADVAIVARRADRLAENKSEIERTYGVRCLTVQCDVCDPDQVRSTVAKVIAEFGKIDILVANAGIGGRGEAAEMSDEDWMKVISTNLCGVYYFCREAGRNMIQNHYGRIINISSLYGLVGKKNMCSASYSAAKGGVIGLTKALACEWGEHGITVNAISPGYYPTELMTPWIDSDKYLEFFRTRCPVGRKGNMNEADSTILFLAAEESSYVTGITVPMDGGWTAG
ncbi:MAG: SDR family oxidoreductase [Oscillibacter sp.]|jgi:gluconate 5-dehydrogenase|nr:SDR family oxidoreductase [Oscillibacter sp.]